MGLIDGVDDAEPTDSLRSQRRLTYDGLGAAPVGVFKELVDGRFDARPQASVLTGEVPRSPSLNDRAVRHVMLGVRLGRRSLPGQPLVRVRIRKDLPGLRDGLLLS